MLKPQQAGLGRYSIYLPRRDGRLSWPWCGYIPRWFNCPQTVTHHGLNGSSSPVLTATSRSYGKAKNPSSNHLIATQPGVELTTVTPPSHPWGPNPVWNNSNKKLSYRLENRASASCYHLIILSGIWLFWALLYVTCVIFSKPTWQRTHANLPE